MEAQLLVAQKREAIGRLVGGVAHDFNNLLTAISGYADRSLEVADASPQQRHDLLEIKRASQRATALTRQLLSFSQQHIIEPRVIDINGVIEALVSMLRRVLAADMPFLEKPFTPAELVRKVRLVLDSEVSVTQPSAQLE